MEQLLPIYSDYLYAMKLIEELKWRGMLHDIMPGVEEQMEKEMTSTYVGFRPYG